MIVSSASYALAMSKVYYWPVRRSSNTEVVVDQRIASRIHSKPQLDEPTNASLLHPGKVKVKS